MDRHVLSIEEIRAWLRARFGHEEVKGSALTKSRDLPNRAFCRAVGLDFADMHRLKHGREKRPVSPARQRVISRFICDWENGLLEFVRLGTGRRNKLRVLVHRETPKLPPARLAIEFVDGPKIRRLARPAPATPMPKFSDAMRNLTKG